MNKNLSCRPLVNMSSRTARYIQITVSHDYDVPKQVNVPGKIVKKI